MLSEQHIAIVRSIHTRLNETQISAPGPSSSGVHVYGRVSVNKEDMLNTSCTVAEHHLWLLYVGNFPFSVLYLKRS